MKIGVFWSSASGRVLAGVTGFAFAGAAGVALLPASGTPTDLALTLLPLLCVVGCMFTIGLSTMDAVGVSAALVILLPWAAGLYFALLNAVLQAGTAVALLLLVLAAGPAWHAARGYGYVALVPRRI